MKEIYNDIEEYNLTLGCCKDEGGEQNIYKFLWFFNAPMKATKGHVHSSQGKYLAGALNDSPV